MSAKKRMPERVTASNFSGVAQMMSAESSPSSPSRSVSPAQVARVGEGAGGSEVQLVRVSEAFLVECARRRGCSGTWLECRRAAPHFTQHPHPMRVNRCPHPAHL